MSDSIYLYQSVSLSPSSQSVIFIFLTLTPNNPILLTVIPPHIIISLVHCSGYTTLLTTLPSHFWWDVLPCHYDPNGPYITFIFFGVWPYEWILYTWVRASWIKFHNCPTRFDLFSLLYSAYRNIINWISCILLGSYKIWLYEYSQYSPQVVLRI